MVELSEVELVKLVELVEFSKDVDDVSVSLRHSSDSASFYRVPAVAI